MKRVMLDLETLGTVPGCSILSIGAVRFDPAKGLGEEFYVVVNRQSCKDAGLHEDPDTIAWWSKQSHEARQLLAQATLPEVSKPLTEALMLYTGFIKSVPGTLVYGNGADFDNPIIAVACRAVGIKQPWQPYNGRCYRTIKADFPADKMGAARTGTHHNALDDAKSQATHLTILAQKWKLKLL